MRSPHPKPLFIPLSEEGKGGLAPSLCGRGRAGVSEGYSNGE